MMKPKPELGVGYWALSARHGGARPGRRRVGRFSLFLARPAVAPYHFEDR
jgi:hypothetical protein